MPIANTKDITSSYNSQLEVQASPNLDGLYLNEWNQSGIIVIHNKKIHHFTRREFTSIYKDEEYDYDGISKEGKINIVRRYYLDRNGKTLPKETLLHDIEPIIDENQLTALIRNGRTFTKMVSLRSLLNTLNDVNLDSYKERYLNEVESPVISDSVIDSPSFYIQIGLPFRQLRDGQIEFYDLFKNLIQSK